jgi:hypothetical protein
MCAKVFCSQLHFFGLYFLATFSMNSNSRGRFCDQIKFLENRFLGLVSIFGKHQWNGHTIPKIQNIYSQEMKLRGLVLDFCIHVSVSDLYIPTIGLANYIGIGPSVEVQRMGSLASISKLESYCCHMLATYCSSTFSQGLKKHIHKHV